jgi:outer membrane lipoprotein LolB
MRQIARWRHYRKLGLATGLALLLGACASLVPPPVPDAPTASYHETIDLSGRLSVLYQQNNKDESLHGSFTWAQTRDATEINLRSPLGQTIAQIAVTPGTATLTRAGEAPRSAVDVDTLTTQTLGWPLPIAGLRDWLQGHAKNTDGSAFIATPQANSVTTSDGWRIRYVTWNDDASPKRIDIERNTSYAGTVALRIVVDERTPH